MKKFILLIISITILTSCGERVKDVIEKDGSKIFYSSDSAFSALIYGFEDDLQRFNKDSFPVENIPVNFYNLEEFNDLSVTDDSLVSYDDSHEVYEKNNIRYEFNTEINEAKNRVRVGVCIKYSDGSREILIRKESWDDYSDIRRKILINHEFGHCALDREHEDSVYNNHKISIMNSVLLRESEYIHYEEEYLVELFELNKTSLYQSIDQE